MIIFYINKLILIAQNSWYIKYYVIYIIINNPVSYVVVVLCIIFLSIQFFSDIWSSCPLIKFMNEYIQPFACIWTCSFYHQTSLCFCFLQLQPFASELAALWDVSVTLRDNKVNY